MWPDKFRPMKAPNDELDESKIVFPKLASVKLDGIRAVIKGGQVLTYTLKPVRNKYIQKCLSDPNLEGLDGELIVGEPNDPLVYNKTYSGVMREDGEPDFMFHVFDKFDQRLPFYERLGMANAAIVCSGDNPRIIFIPHWECNSLDELHVREELILRNGYEGIMLRDHNGKYKCGRATVKENTLLKVKRFVDAEAEVIGFIEQLTNNNVKIKNEHGLSKRQKIKENMTPAGTLGSFQCRDIVTGVEFDCGPGVLKEEELQEIWDNQRNYLGKILTYKHFPIGAKDRPRMPSYKGWRSADDFEPAKHAGEIADER